MVGNRVKCVFVISSIYVFNVHNAESISLCDATFLASGSSESKRKSEAYNVDKQKADKVAVCADF